MEFCSFNLPILDYEKAFSTPPRRNEMYNPRCNYVTETKTEGMLWERVTYPRWTKASLVTCNFYVFGSSYTDETRGTQLNPLSSTGTL